MQLTLGGLESDMPTMQVVIVTKKGWERSWLMQLAREGELDGFIDYKSLSAHGQKQVISSTPNHEQASGKLIQLGHDF